MKPEVLAEPILVGRENELQVLTLFLEDVIAGKGKTIFVSGEAGSGKTRLTHEFLKSAKARGVRVLSGWCLSNAAMPYFPFIEAFESFHARNESDQSLITQQLGLKNWLTEVAQAEGLSPQAWRDRNFVAVTKELLFISTDQPLILFIDDLHWADSASLALLHYVARVISSERILLLGTFRTEELAPTTEGLAHPLLDTLRLMSREDLFKEIKLGNLSPTDICRIAENLLGGKIQTNLQEKLALESRGNPLFVVESLRMLYEKGDLSQVAGKWHISSDTITVPVKVKDIILQRLSLLKPEQRRMLDVASVIGDKFDPQLLGAVFNIDSLQILEALNSVALHSSLVGVEGDYYIFDHARTREVLYDEILMPLKKGYHERVAEKLESLKATRPRATDLAYHYSKAGNIKKSVQFSLEAGKDSLARFSNSEASKNFYYVMQAIDENPEYITERFIALEGLADSLFAAGQFEEAIKSLEQLTAQLPSDAAKLRVLRKTMLSAYWRGNRAFALEIAAKANQYADADNLEYARLRLYRGFIAGREGKTEEALRDIEESLQVFENECSLPDLASALVEISFLYPYVDRLEDAISTALRAVSIYHELDDLRATELAYNRLGVAFSLSGFSHEAVENFLKAIKLGEKVSNSNSLAFDYSMIAQIFEVGIDFPTSIKYSLKGARYAEKTDAYYAQSICYANLVREYALSGDVIHAEEYGKKLDHICRKSRDLGINLQAIAWMSDACLLSIRKRWKEANAVFEKVLSLPMPKMMQSNTKAAYSWALLKQGRLQEAQLTFAKSQEIAKDVRARFQKCRLQAFIVAEKNVFVGNEFKVRLDIVNVSKADAYLERIKDFVPPAFEVLQASALRNENSSLFELSHRTLGSFTTETLELALTPRKAGVFLLEPKIVYIDNKGKSNELILKPINLIVGQKPDSAKKEPVSVYAAIRMDFSSDSAQRIFDYLIRAFKEDLHRQKLPMDRCGWRTMMNIVKQGKVSKYSIYGSESNSGKVLKELQHDCLIEMRVFTSERGRGGQVRKVRIDCENPIVQKRISG